MPRQFYGLDLAELHNRYYAEFVESAAPQAISLLRSRGIWSGVVLDLGCGGGQLSAQLLKAGYTPIGLDVSAAMVRLARKRVPRATFVQGSVSRAKLPQASAVVAVGEVFNYLSSGAELLRALLNIYRSLLPGGVLLFDIKEPLPGRDIEVRSGARWGSGWAILVEVEEDAQKRRLVRRIVTFRAAGRSYRRNEEEHMQILLKAADVSTALQSVGFRARVLKGYGPKRLAPDRKVLIAVKPA